MLGLAHALANPLTATLGVPHGQAVGLMMPHVVKFNGVEVEHRYTELLHLVSPAYDPNAKGRSASEKIATIFREWLTRAGLAGSLSKLPQWPTHLQDNQSAKDEFLQTLAASAAKQWTASFNPRKATEQDLLELYRSAL